MTLTNTTSLMGAGSALGPWGAGIGAALGLGLDLWGAANSDSAAALQANSDWLNYKTQAGVTETQIAQAKSDISAYETFLAAFPNYAELKKTSFEAASRSEFKGLMSNFAMGNVNAGASGRAGGSAGLVSAEDRRELVDYTGEDMALGGGDGGRYQLAQAELYSDISAEESQAKSQLEILKTSLPNLEAAFTDYTKAAADAEARAKKADAAVAGWNKAGDVLDVATDFLIPAKGISKVFGWDWW